MTENTLPLAAEQRFSLLQSSAFQPVVDGGSSVVTRGYFGITIVHNYKVVDCTVKTVISMFNGKQKRLQSVHQNHLTVRISVPPLSSNCARQTRDVTTQNVETFLFGCSITLLTVVSTEGKLWSHKHKFAAFSIMLRYSQGEGQAKSMRFAKCFGSPNDLQFHWLGPVPSQGTL